MWVLDTDPFTPRSACGSGWTPAEIALAEWGNGMVAAAYLGIGLVLGFVWWKRRRDVPRPEFLALFGAFIFLCGVTHVYDVVVFWWPAYRLFNRTDLLLGVISLATLAALLPATETFLAAPGPADYAAALADRDRALAAAGRDRDKLADALRLVTSERDAAARKVQEAQDAGRADDWATAQEVKLTGILNQLQTGTGGHDPIR